MTTTPRAPKKRATPVRAASPYAGHSPARLTASATLQLPRWALIALCLVYILPGLVGRDPWKSEDASAFGAMWTMATGVGYGGIADWLLPNVAGAPVLESGPLMYWVGAICMTLFGGLLGVDMAGRLATVIFFFVAVTGIWYATYLVGRRAAAQPVALAFGGQPEARDYGRVLADGALLILLATIGLLIRVHETSSDVAMLAMLALGLYGMARSLEHPEAGIGMDRRGTGRPRADARAGAGGRDGAALDRTDHAAGRVPGRAPRGADDPAARHARRPRSLAAARVDRVARRERPHRTACRRVVASHRRDRCAGREQIRAHAAVDHVDRLAARRVGLWTWRRRPGAAHIVLPAGFVLAMLAVLCSTSDTSDGQLLLVLPGIVMLAAFGLPPCGAARPTPSTGSALLFYSFAAIFVWFAWFAKMTGAPAGFARSIARLTPGSSPSSGRSCSHSRSRPPSPGSRSCAGASSPSQGALAQRGPRLGRTDLA